MTYTSIVLTDPASGLSSVIKPRDGVACTSLDVQPAIRAVSDPVPGGDGAADVTQYLDAASVTLSLRLWTSAAGTTPEDWLEEIAPLLAPWRRPQLVVANDQWATPRQLTVRFDSRTAPVDNPATTDLALSWKIPAGVWQDTAQSVFSVSASSASTAGLILTATTGLKLTAAAPGLDMPPSTTASDAIITVPGSASPPWTAKLYGPCAGPKLANDTAGYDLIFTDSLVLAAGQYVQLGSDRTANLLSDPAQSVLGFLDFADSDWWQLVPGVPNLLRYHPTSGTGLAQVTFFPAMIP